MIQKKICSGCESEQYIWKRYEGQPYCKMCWSKIKFDNEAPKPKKYTAIKPKSKKQIELDKIYTKLRRIFLEQHSMCQIAYPGCQGMATDIHHTDGRGKNYLVVATWKSSCRYCHDYLHFVDPKGARELGFLK